ncbi:hypothetical protein ACTFIV_010035 [Dictyostelium citrinum]
MDTPILLKILKPETQCLDFISRCLPINYLHNKHCPLCNEDIGKDPYGHLFFSCKNWHHTRINQNNKFINRITSRYHLTPKKTTKSTLTTQTLGFHREYFEWNYKAIYYDLSRSLAYKNLIALILHNIWISICNQIYSDNPSTDITLSYSPSQKMPITIVSTSLPNIISFDQFI